MFTMVNAEHGFWGPSSAINGVVMGVCSQLFVIGLAHCLLKCRPRSGMLTPHLPVSVLSFEKGVLSILLWCPEFETQRTFANAIACVPMKPIHSAPRRNRRQQIAIVKKSRGI